MQIKDERWKLRREFTISYKELTDKFPELPKTARLYGCHWDQGKYGGWGTDNEAGIILTLDFEEENIK